MTKELLRITGRHKKTLKTAEFFFSSIKECAFFNPDFKDFEVKGEIKLLNNCLKSQMLQS